MASFFNDFENYFVIDSLPIEVCKFSRSARSNVCRENIETDPNIAFSNLTSITTEIWVAGGTYTPIGNGTNSTFSVVNNGFKLYGGFEGTEIQVSDRDIINNPPTIFEGDVNGNDISTDPYETTRNDNIIKMISLNANYFELNGVTIQGTNSSLAGAAIFSENNDFTLLIASPAINTGNNTKIPSGITTDLLGNQRIFNTTVDMGAFEFGSSPLSTESISFLSETNMYPNPVTSNLFIKSNEDILKIEVYNLLGKKIIEKENSSFINLSNLASSMYVVRVYKQKGIVSKRIIKKIILKEFVF